MALYDSSQRMSKGRCLKLSCGKPENKPSPISQEMDGENQTQQYKQTEKLRWQDRDFSFCLRKEQLTSGKERVCV